MKIIILGGGTAGLISALILKQSNQSFDITLIKSDKIGIVGVGEGSTEHWANFCKFVDISPVEVIRECGATFKYGIRFDNWNGDGDHYYHAVVSGYIQESYLGYPFIYHKLITDSLHPNDIIPKFIQNSEHYPPYETSVNQFHFDTFKLNGFLLNKCKERQIKIVEDIIDNISIDENGINILQGRSSIRYKANLYIDASGFNRLLHSNLKSDWKDCSAFLPLNSAFNFPTNLETAVSSSYTRCTALNAGWVWQIPTQERFGNGYVYNDSFITEEKAIEEVCIFYKQDIKKIKSFKFSPGYLRNPWEKNVCAIGLSSNFVEPLEASNIGSAIQQTFALASFLPLWEEGDNKTPKLYNEHMVDLFQNIIDFIQLHYITKRKDTEFWKFCKNLELTDFNKETLPIFSKQMPLVPLFLKPYNMFKAYNWLQIYNGLGILDKESIIENFNKMPFHLQLEASIKIMSIKEISYEKSIPNLEALEKINRGIYEY